MEYLHKITVVGMAPAADTKEIQDQKSASKVNQSKAPEGKYAQENRKIKAAPKERAKQEKGQEIKDLKLKVLDNDKLELK